MGATRNILAAILMFLIFLMIPGYLELIGLEPDNNSENSATPQTIDVEVGNNEPVVSPIETHNAGVYSQTSSKNIRIITDLFDITVSNRGGGSLVEYRLISQNDNGLKYMGSYNQNGDYNSSDPVLLNYDLLDLGCSPCLSLNHQKTLINHPFDLITNLNDDTVRIGGDESFELYYRYENNLGE